MNFNHILIELRWDSSESIEACRGGCYRIIYQCHFPFATSSSQRIVASAARYRHKRGKNGETRGSCWIFIGRIRIQLGHFGALTALTGSEPWWIMLNPNQISPFAGKGKRKKINNKRKRKYTVVGSLECDCHPFPCHRYPLTFITTSWSRWDRSRSLHFHHVVGNFSCRGRRRAEEMKKTSLPT